MTFGKVRGYIPRDGMMYTPFTRLEGIAEKNTGEDPFDMPAAVLEGLPGSMGARVVQAGEQYGGLVVHNITRDTVWVAGPDTTWTLTLRRLR